MIKKPHPKAFSLVLVSSVVLGLSSGFGMATETDDMVTCQPVGTLTGDAGAAAFCQALSAAVAAASPRAYDLRLTAFSSEHLAVEVRDPTDPAHPMRMIQRRMLDLVLTPDNYNDFAAQVVRSAIRQGTIIGR